MDFFFFFSSRRRHTRLVSDWSSDVCSSDLRCRAPFMTETSAPALVVAIVDRDRIFSLGLQAWVSQRLGQGRTVTVEIFDRAAPLLQEIDTEALSVGLAIVGDLPAVEPACQALSERRVPVLVVVERSEERRVGKGCRSRWSPYH